MYLHIYISMFSQRYLMTNSMFSRPKPRALEGASAVPGRVNHIQEPSAGESVHWGPWGFIVRGRDHRTGIFWFYVRFPGTTNCHVAPENWVTQSYQISRCMSTGVL